MARISKYKLTEAAIEKLSELLFEMIAKQTNKKTFEKIINDILSPTERVMVAKRIAIVYLLLKNIDHRTICGVLKVSSATVAKFVLLMEKSDGLVPAFKKMLRNEKIALVLFEMFAIIFSYPNPGTNWGTAARRLKYIQRLKETGI